MSFVSDIFNIGAELYNNERNRKEQRAAEERERAYNHPTAQMERLKEAGLNPNLIYGSGSATGNLNASAPEQNAPKVSFDPLERQRMLADTQKLKDEGRVASANADVAEHDAKVVKSRPGILSQESPYNSILKSSLDSVRDVSRNFFSNKFWDKKYNQVKDWFKSSF
jgi:hypothetical protein